MTEICNKRATSPLLFLLFLELLGSLFLAFKVTFFFGVLGLFIEKR